MPKRSSCQPTLKSGWVTTQAYRLLQRKRGNRFKEGGWERKFGGKKPSPALGENLVKRSRKKFTREFISCVDTPANNQRGINEFFLVAVIVRLIRKVVRKRVHLRAMGSIGL